MGHEGKLSRQAVNLSLPADLVERAAACTSDLGGTVEVLLTRYVALEEGRRQMDEAKLRVLLDALNRLMTEEGTIADDFSPL